MESKLLEIFGDEESCAEFINEVADRAFKKSNFYIPPKLKKPNAYELTLTTEVDEPQKIVDSLYKIVESKMMPEILSWSACLELTKNKLPHIHCYIETTGVIQPSKVKKLYKKRYSLSKVRNRGAFLAYIEKEKNNEEVINYCIEKKCQQFYSSDAEKIVQKEIVQKEGDDAVQDA